MGHLSMVIRGLSREKWFQSRGMFDLEVLAVMAELGALLNYFS
jgi:hypothetical protein